GVVALLEGSGGVADAAGDWLARGYLNAKPSFRVVADRRPRRLVAKAEAAYRGLGGRTLGADQLVSPGKARAVLTDADTRKRVVAAFMVTDERLSPADEAATRDLVSAWSVASTDAAPKGTTVVLPDDPGALELATR